MKIFSKILNKREIDDELSENSCSSDEHVLSVTIPEPTVKTREIASPLKTSTSIFNITQKDDSGEYFRIQSNSSHEVFRIIGHGYEHCIDDMPFNNKIFSFLKETCEYDFMIRVFVTDSGRYFKQSVCPDGNVGRYKILSYYDAQKLAIDAENSAKFTYTGGSYTVLKPGTYDYDDISDNAYETVKDVENYVSYEIIDKKLYDEIIKPL